MKAAADVHVGIDDSGGDALIYTSTDAGQTAAVPMKLQANSFKFNGSSEFMRIDPLGNVGIGITSPQTGLQVASTSYTYSGTPYDIYSLFGTTAGGVRLGRDSGSADGVIGTTGTGGLQFVTYDGSAWDSRMTLTNAGNVGIGTDSPSALLHLKATGGSVIQQFETTGGTTNRIWKNFVSSSTGDYHIQDATALSNRVIITAAGVTQVTGGFEAAQPGAGTYAFAAGYNAGLTTQGEYGTAVGVNAGNSGQGRLAPRLSGGTLDTQAKVVVLSL